MTNNSQVCVDTTGRCQCDQCRKFIATEAHTVVDIAAVEYFDLNEGEREAILSNFDSDHYDEPREVWAEFMRINDRRKARCLS